MMSIEFKILFRSIITITFYDVCLIMICVALSPNFVHRRTGFKSIAIMSLCTFSRLSILNLSTTIINRSTTAQQTLPLIKLLLLTSPNSTSRKKLNTTPDRMAINEESKVGQTMSEVSKQEGRTNKGKSSSPVLVNVISLTSIRVYRRPDAVSNN